MILISGIHGSGKTFFCEQVKEKTGYLIYSASKLIAERKQLTFASDKLIPDIDDNQKFLLAAVDELNKINTAYLLDGHFCLLNAEGNITKIKKDTFIYLNPHAFILITEKPEIIAERRNERDNIKQTTKDISMFQETEISYAIELSDLLGIPLHIHSNNDDFNNSLEFIHAQMRRIKNAR